MGAAAGFTTAGLATSAGFGTAGSVAVVDASGAALAVMAGQSEANWGACRCRVCIFIPAVMAAIAQAVTAANCRKPFMPNPAA